MEDAAATSKAIGVIQSNVKSVYRRLSYLLPMISAIQAFYLLNGEVNRELAQHVDEEMLAVLRILSATVDLFQSDDIPF